MRKYLLTLALAGGFAFGPADAAEDPELEAFVAGSRAMVDESASSLKSALQAAIEEGGPTNAISVCNVKAPGIAGALSRHPQWRIGRTSHKVRNPNNAPDAWEAGVLEEFLQRAAAGESFSTMEKAERVEGSGGALYRFMKAIPVGDICLTCHGTDVVPDLKSKIDAYYPTDEATGFKMGELRGAFTITKAAQN